MKHKNARRGESGNVMFYIFAGIALLAALSFAVSQGSRGSIHSMSEDRARLHASEIMAFADAVAKAGQTLRLRGVPANMLDFNAAGLTGFDNPACAGADCEIFNPAGGGVNYSAPPAEWLDSSFASQPAYGHAHFDGQVCIPQVGSASAGCESDGAANEALVAFIPYIKRDLCVAINNISHIGVRDAEPPEVDDCAFSARFTGGFADGMILDAPEVAGKNAACVKTASTCTNGGGAYHYYQVVIAR